MNASAAHLHRAAVLLAVLVALVPSRTFAAAPTAIDFRYSPPEWLGPGMVTRLEGVATPFGPLHLTVRASQKGASATLSVKPLAPHCRALVVHLPDGGTRQLDPRRGGRISFATTIIPTTK